MVNTLSLYRKGNKISIKPIEIADSEAIHEYASNPNAKQYTGWKLMESLEETQEFVALMVSRHEEKTHVYASVVENETGKVIGTLMIFGFDKEANHAEIGYVFNEAVWGKGYASEGVKLLCDYAFNEMALRKLFARIVEINVGSAKVLKKNDFVLEGTLKDYYCIHGALLNCQWFSKLATF